jgi:hypothetical protein
MMIVLWQFSGGRPIMFALRSLALTGIFIAATAALPAHAAGPFDGTYVGPLTLTTGGGGASCPPGTTVTRIVTDSVMPMKWGTNNSEIHIKVSADGSINDSGSIGSALATVRGKIANGMMTYDVGGARCNYHFEGRKRG